MKKLFLLPFLLIMLISGFTSAQSAHFFFNNGSEVLHNLNDVREFTIDNTMLYVHLNSGSFTEYQISTIRKITFDDFVTGNSENTAPVQNDLTVFPNPSTNLSFTLNYSLPAAEFTKIILYDMTGKEVATVFEGVQQAGIQKITYSFTQLPKASYVCRVYNSSVNLRKIISLN